MLDVTPIPLAALELWLNRDQLRIKPAAPETITLIETRQTLYARPRD